MFFYVVTGIAFILIIIQAAAKMPMFLEADHQKIRNTFVTFGVVLLGVFFVSLHLLSHVKKGGIGIERNERAY